MTIRVLEADEAERYNTFFRGGVEQHPDAFRIDASDIDDSPFSTVPCDDALTFVAEEQGVWQGIVSIERERGRRQRQHVAWLVRMYVATEAAGRGVGRALVREAVAQTRRLPGIERLNLTVVADNERACSLYESEGFVRFAHELNALRDASGRYRDEFQLSRTL
jgi:GNAT superfamily N-acetyltransferase